MVPQMCSRRSIVTAEELATSVRGFVEEVNQGDPDAVERHIAGEFFNYAPEPDDINATQAWSQLLADLRAGMPDLHVDIDDLHQAGDDRLAGSVTIRGTHTGTLWGAPPTGTVITWQPQVSIRAVDGRFAVNFDGLAAPDMIGLMRQIGVVNPADQMHLPPRNPNVRAPEFVLRVAFNGGVAPRACSHLDAATVFDSGVTVCEQCVASGDPWPALRLCMSCDFVGCCDTSINKHMKQHAEETGHVLMRSIHGPEGWIWCYADNAFFDSRTLARLRAQRAGA
jgi:predicted ester cyclase